MACFEHPDRPAVGTCSACGHEICEQCLAEKRPEGIVCRQCTMRMIAAGIEDDREKKAEDRKRARKLTRKRRWPVILGFVVIAAELGFILWDPPGFAPSPAPWTIGVPAPAKDRGRECCDRLFRLRVVVDRKAFQQKKPLASLDELGPEVQKTCPASGDPYRYSVNADGVVEIACPNPEMHGVAAIFSRGDVVPPVVKPLGAKKEEKP